MAVEAPAIGAEVTIIIERGPVRVRVMVHYRLHDAFTTALPGDGSPHFWRLEDEGITWARGWDTPEADALRTAYALRPIRDVG